MNKEGRKIAIQILLFLATFITTTLAGSEWVYSKSILVAGYSWSDFVQGMWFSVPLIMILTVHEFGHYFTALHHKVKTSLPYFIPVPPGLMSIGTMGAIIRIRSRVRVNIQHFDIGLAGPLAGFVLALMILFYGFTHLPPPEYVFQFHPDYEQYGLNYGDSVYTDMYFKKQALAGNPSIDVEFGDNLLFLFFEKFVADPERVPNAHELMHYPLLMAGFIALFFTSLNLLPIGQLDGGHIVYGLFGAKGHGWIATLSFLGLLFYSGLGLIDVNNLEQRDALIWSIPLLIGFYYLCLMGLKLPVKDTVMYALVIFTVQLLVTWLFHVEGYSAWLLFGFLLGRVLGVKHPPSEIELPLDEKRKILGWIALLIFVLCFSPVPITMG